MKWEKPFLGTFLNFLLRPFMKSKTKCDSVGLGSKEPKFPEKIQGASRRKYRI
jgi:hypothetical protein